MERVACATPGCAATILPSTAEKTGGLCMPCQNRRAAEAWARHVAANRVDVDRFAGVSDVVEILRLLHTPPPSNPLENQLPYPKSAADLYRGLPDHDAQRLVAVATQDHGLLRDVAVHLACFSSVDRTPLQHALLDREDPYPALAFRGPTTREVVARLEALVERGVQVDHTLSALAWTRHDTLVQELVDWTNTRPTLRRQLHISPSDYARVAGFEIEAGRARELTSPSCFRLRIGAEGATASLFEPAGTCSLCGRAAVHLVKFDAGAPDAFSGLPPLVTCLDCATADVAFVRVDGARIEWLGDVCERAEGWDLAPARVALVARPAWEAVEWTCADGLSQLGGHPSWIVDLDYRRCPGCARTMRFVAQVGLQDLGGEGAFYAQHCDDCAIVGVTYQQT